MTPALTPRGRGVLGAGLAATGAALALGSLAAAVLGVGLLFALALAAAPRPAPQITARRSLEPEAAREGTEVRMRLEVTVAGRASARLGLHDAPPPGVERTGGVGSAVPLGRGRSVLEATVAARVPGRFRWRPATVRWGDAAGLTERVFPLEAPASLTAYPEVSDLRAAVVSSRLARILQGTHLVRQAGPGTEFHALREFQPGDPLRTVNWRASARTPGRLLVNQRERESHARVTLLVDGRAAALAGGPTAHGWAMALRAVAAVASAGFRLRDVARVVVYGRGTPARLATRPGDPAQLALLDALLDVQPAGDEGLAAAVREVLPSLRPGEPVLVASTFAGDAGADEAVAALRSIDCPVAVLALDGPALLAAGGAPQAEVAAARAARAHLLAALRARGATVVAWSPGEPLGVALAKEAAA